MHTADRLPTSLSPVGLSRRRYRIVSSSGTLKQAPPRDVRAFALGATTSGRSYSLAHHSHMFPHMSSAPTGEQPCGYIPTLIRRLVVFRWLARSSIQSGPHG